MAKTDEFDGKRVVSTDKTIHENIRLSDFRWSRMHPVARKRVLLALVVTFCLILGCIWMLSTTTITPHPDTSTSAGIQQALKNVLAALYVVGTLGTTVALWWLMLHDCPLTEAAKANYDASHDDGIKGVKVIAALATAITSKGSGSSITGLAQAVEDYAHKPDQSKDGRFAQSGNKKPSESKSEATR